MDDTAEKGKIYLMNGWLKTFMATTGVSRAHLAKMINVMPETIHRWEAGRVGNVSLTSARKVHDLAAQYLLVEDWKREHNLRWANLMPLHIAAMRLGMSVREVEQLLVAKDVVVLDFGMMGRWLTVDDIEICRRR